MSGIVALDDLETGDRARVLVLRGGRDFQHRIRSMGISVGDEIEVLQGNANVCEHGGVVVRVGDTRLMLGQGMAKKIMVKQ